jgi:DNA adenine methylase
MGKEPAKGGEVLNDLNDDVVNLFTILRDPVRAEELQGKLRLTPYAETEFHAARDVPADADSIERARCYCVRSFFGVEVSGLKGNNTGFRMKNVNLTSGNFRKCAVDWDNWRECIPMFTERLRQVKVWKKDAFEVFDQFTHPDTLFYVDPPYYPLSRSSNKRYVHDMTAEQHEDLIDKLEFHPSKIVISGYDCDPYGALEAVGWTTVSKTSRKNMGSSPSEEKLWINPAAQATLTK